MPAATLAALELADQGMYRIVVTRADNTTPVDLRLTGTSIVFRAWLPDATSDLIVKTWTAPSTPAGITVDPADPGNTATLTINPADTASLTATTRLEAKLTLTEPGGQGPTTLFRGTLPVIK